MEAKELNCKDVFLFVLGVAPELCAVVGAIASELGEEVSPRRFHEFTMSAGVDRHEKG